MLQERIREGLTFDPDGNRDGPGGRPRYHS